MRHITQSKKCRTRANCRKSGDAATGKLKFFFRKTRNQFFPRTYTEFEVLPKFCSSRRTGPQTQSPNAIAFDALCRNRPRDSDWSQCVYGHSILSARMPDQDCGAVGTPTEHNELAECRRATDDYSNRRRLVATELVLLKCIHYIAPRGGCRRRPLGEGGSAALSQVPQPSSPHVFAMLAYHPHYWAVQFP